MKRIVTFGTFDLFHVGHLRILDRCKAIGDYLAVGVSTDEFSFHKKGRYPIYPFTQRMEILCALRAVDVAFAEDSFERKREYLIEQKADVLVMGDDWKGKFDNFSDIVQVVYLTRTPSISTTAIVETIRK